LPSSNADDQLKRSAEGPAANGEAIEHFAALDGDRMTEEINKEKIRRAMLAGPSVVTSEATIAEMDQQGRLIILRPGKNEWVCIPGDQNVVGRPDMALDPMGMTWFKDVQAKLAWPTSPAYEDISEVVGNCAGDSGICAWLTTVDEG
jgi:hypothetical protein